MKERWGIAKTLIWLRTKRTKRMWMYPWPLKQMPMIWKPWPPLLSLTTTPAILLENWWPSSTSCECQPNSHAITLSACVSCKMSNRLNSFFGSKHNGVASRTVWRQPSPFKRYHLLFIAYLKILMCIQGYRQFLSHSRYKWWTPTSQKQVLVWLSAHIFGVESYQACPWLPKGQLPFTTMMSS